MLEAIQQGDEKTYDKAMREFGLNGVATGEQTLGAEGMKPKNLSTKERSEIEENLDRHD